MRSPPFSSEMSFSASRRDSPADEVESLLSSALQVTALDPNLESIFRKHKYLFLDVFSRQIELIRSRSQAFEDAHITVYDRVLLTLTRNGNNLEDPAAITWYATEHLGFNPNGGTARNAQFIEQGLALSVAVNQAHKSLEHVAGPSTAPPFDHSVSQDIHSSLKNDPVFARLWTVYEKARAEYFEVADDNNFRTGESARFLRDTAENGIHYLAKHPNRDVRLNEELTNTYNTATRAVERLCGGKKRKFDHVVDKNRYGRPTRRPALMSSHASSKPSGHHGKGRLPSRSQNPGRGHSGLPYGYSKTRDVDSYVPTRG